VGVAQTKTFMLHLAAPATSKRHKGGIAAYPLLATRRLHSRCRWSATKAARCTGHGLGVHPIVRHPSPLVSWGAYGSRPPRALCRCITQRTALSSWAMVSSRVSARRPRRRVLTREGVMSQWSTGRHSRHQWQHKATPRADHDRSRRQQLARVTHERDRINKALQEAQARLRQREAQSQGRDVPNKVDLVWCALQLF
jgi:hypothetical protein